MSLKQQRLELISARITQIPPADAFSRQQQGAVLLDVREPVSVEQGSPVGAIRQSRGFLELMIEQQLPEPDQEIIVLCETGVCSLFAADDLIRLGYTNVMSVKGGYAAWKSAGLHTEVPVQLGSDARARYARHLVIPEIGEQGQKRLLTARVLIIGAGGLGSPVALYLAAAGVGTIGIIDNDIVDRSNLQRQILHDDAHIGTAKIESARYRLRSLNPEINVQTYNLRLDADNANKIISDYDLVVDGADNLATRYSVNDACLELGIPLVYGAVFRFQGQVSVFNHKAADGSRKACYRCLFADNNTSEPPSCSDVGVLGVLPGVIGTLQATEALKVLLNIGEPLAGSLLSYDALSAEFRKTRLPADPNCRCRKYSGLL